MILRALPLLAAAALSGCAHLGAVHRDWREGLDGDVRLRQYLIAGQPDSALRLLAPRKRDTRDGLLLELQRAVVLHEARQYAGSNQALERAEAEIDRRFTRSVGRAAGSMVVNDGLLAYLPPAPERAMIPYYRMLNYWALGQTDGALVEARKAGALLAGNDVAKTGGCWGAGLLSYVSGQVFAAGGERNHALVSLRQADRAYDGCTGSGGVAAPPQLGRDLFQAARALGLRDVADAAAKRYSIADAPDTTQTGDLVVLVEHGFVAHRTHQDIHVPILGDELRAMESEEGDSVAAAIGRASTRLLGNLLQQAEWGHAYDESPSRQWADALEGAYIFKLAWPAYRLDARRATAVRVIVNDQVVAAPPAEDLSAGVVKAWESQRPAVLARAVARGLAKFQLARQAERKAEKQGGETAGWIVGRLANVAGNLSERADTRGWTLLPDQISVARLTLPPGSHQVRLETLGATGEVIGNVDLGTVNVRPGGRTLLSRRVWPRVATSRCAASAAPPSRSAPEGSSECQ
ncbi:hypothetical protein BH23GEM5_BH23GEM5_19060 [soil metagenome]